MPYDNVILVIAIAALAVPITVVGVVTIGRIPRALELFLGLVKGQPTVGQRREYPRQFRRLISGSHMILATLVLFGAVAWGVSAFNGALEYPLFNLAFVIWLLARVPLLYRESLLMSKGRAQERWMTRTDFVILGVGNVGAGVLFGISAWIEGSALAAVLSIVFLLWGSLNWFVVISEPQANNQTNQA